MVHITPLPFHVPRSLVIDLFHDHESMIRLNPLVTSFQRCLVPPNASPDEVQSIWYEITDKISYFPGLSGSVTYKACLHDLPDALQTHIYAPAGVRIRGRWSVGGNMPGEPRQPVELRREGVPMEGLYVREEVDLTCNIFLSSITKKNLKAGHAELVERLLKKAERFQSQNDNNDNNAKVKETPPARPDRDAPLPPLPHQPQQRYYTRHTSENINELDTANASHSTTDAAPYQQSYTDRHPRTVSMITVELPGSTPTTPVKDKSINSNRYSYSGSATHLPGHHELPSLSPKYRNSSHRSSGHFGNLAIPRPVSESVEKENNRVPSSHASPRPNSNDQLALSSKPTSEPSTRFSHYSSLSADFNSSKPLSGPPTTRTGSPSYTSTFSHTSPHTVLALRQSLDTPLPSLARTNAPNPTHPTRYGHVITRGSIVELPAYAADPLLPEARSGNRASRNLNSEVASIPQSASSTLSEQPSSAEKDADTEWNRDRDRDRDNESSSLNPSTVPTSPDPDTSIADVSSKYDTANTSHSEAAPNGPAELDTTPNTTNSAVNATPVIIEDATSEKSVDLPVMTTDTLPSPTPVNPPAPAWKEGKVLLV